MHPNPPSASTVLKIVIADRGRSIPIDLADVESSLGTRSPMIGDAPVWLAAAARVQQYASVSGSLDVPGIDSHLIEIKGLATGGRLTQFKEAAARAMGPSLFAFTNLMATYSMRARNASSKDSQSEAMFAKSTQMLRSLARRAHLVGGAHIEPSARPDSIEARAEWLLPALNKVVLHDRADQIDPNGFASRIDYATYVIAHELGHIVQFAHAKSDPKSFSGINSSSPDKASALQALGLDDLDAIWNKNRSFENAALHHISENYADVFAALSISGSDRHKLIANIDTIFATRANHFSTDCALYDTKRCDVYHDTREALAALRAHVAEGGSIPVGSKAIHKATMGFSQQGSLRWAAKLATSQAGPISELARARLLKAMPHCAPALIAETLARAAGGPSLVELAGAPQDFRAKDKLALSRRIIKAITDPLKPHTPKKLAR